MNNLAALLFDQSEYDQSMLLLEDALVTVPSFAMQFVLTNYRSENCVGVPGERYSPFIFFHSKQFGVRV